MGDNRRLGAVLVCSGWDVGNGDQTLQNLRRASEEWLARAGFGGGTISRGKGDGGGS